MSVYVCGASASTAPRYARTPSARYDQRAVKDRNTAMVHDSSQAAACLRSERLGGLEARVHALGVGDERHVSARPLDVAFANRQREVGARHSYEGRGTPCVLRELRVRREHRVTSLFYDT